MARRGRSNPLDDVFELVAFMPWWGGVVLALASYIGLHLYADQTMAPLTAGAPAGAMFHQSILQALAGVLQYVVPGVCLAAAAASALKAGQRQALVHGVTSSQSASSLEGMSWHEFELLVGEAFRQKGFRVLELGGAGADGGIDLVMVKGGETFLVQCKQWKAFKVGVEIVRAMYGVMAAKGAAGGFVVTSGRFTAEARTFARGRNLDLVDGARLFAMLQSAKAGIKTRPSALALRAAETESSAPACPVCGSYMIQRQAQRGAHAGSLFWGCSTHPKCRGIVQI